MGRLLASESRRKRLEQALGIPVLQYEGDLYPVTELPPEALLEMIHKARHLAAYAPNVARTAVLLQDEKQRRERGKGLSRYYDPTMRGWLRWWAHELVRWLKHLFA